jgi:hypothetical protein
VNEVSDITKDSIEHTIGNQLYQRNMVNKWVNNVIDKSLMRLCQLAKPFKYMSNTILSLVSVIYLIVYHTFVFLVNL